MIQHETQNLKAEILIVCFINYKIEIKREVILLKNKTTAIHQFLLSQDLGIKKASTFL